MSQKRFCQAEKSISFQEDGQKRSKLNLPLSQIAQFFPLKKVLKKPTVGLGAGFWDPSQDMAKLVHNSITATATGKPLLL